MPRVGHPANASNAQRTRDYRARLRKRGAPPEPGKPEGRGAPESCHVDVALAAAVAAYRYSAAIEGGGPGHRKVVTALIAATIALLVERGYDQKEAVRVVRHRLRRDDLLDLAKTAAIPERLQAIEKRLAP